MTDLDITGCKNLNSMYEEYNTGSFKEERVDRIMELLVPYKAKGVDKIRIGSKHDGGYVMLDDFSDIKVALSAGVGDDDKWELDMSSKGIKVEAFDMCFADREKYTHQKPYNMYSIFVNIYASYCTTFDIALSGYNEGEAIVKVDVEGEEYNILSYLRSDNLDKIKQIVCEFHIFDLFHFSTIGLASLENICSKFNVVHVHANNNCDYFDINGHIIPKLLEVTFANKKFYDFELSDEAFPTVFDSPNNPDNEDFVLVKRI